MDTLSSIATQILVWNLRLVPLALYCGSLCFKFHSLWNIWWRFVMHSLKGRLDINIRMFVLLFLFSNYISFTDSGNSVHGQRWWSSQYGGWTQSCLTRHLNSPFIILLILTCSFSWFQLKNTLHELEECRHSLNTCLEENAKLNRLEKLAFLFSPLYWHP